MDTRASGLPRARSTLALCPSRLASSMSTAIEQSPARPATAFGASTSTSVTRPLNALVRHKVLSRKPSVPIGPASARPGSHQLHPQPLSLGPKKLLPSHSMLNLGAQRPHLQASPRAHAVSKPLRRQVSKSQLCSLTGGSGTPLGPKRFIPSAPRPAHVDHGASKLTPFTPARRPTLERPSCTSGTPLLPRLVPRSFPEGKQDLLTNVELSFEDDSAEFSPIRPAVVHKPRPRPQNPTPTTASATDTRLACAKQQLQAAQDEISSLKAALARRHWTEILRAGEQALEEERALLALVYWAKDKLSHTI